MHVRQRHESIRQPKPRLHHIVPPIDSVTGEVEIARLGRVPCNIRERRVITGKELTLIGWKQRGNRVAFFT